MKKITDESLTTVGAMKEAFEKFATPVIKEMSRERYAEGYKDGVEAACAALPCEISTRCRCPSKAAAPCESCAAYHRIMVALAALASPEVEPTGEPCPHLRVGTREGKPWTCWDCGAVRVNGEWSAAPADARLIAAAPELLDALRFIHEHAFEAKWSGDERGLGLVEAAIAKAEGRAP